jgi:hypothetical protein
MKKTNKLDVWMISRVSAFLGQSIDGETENFITWLVETKGEISTIFLDFEKKELGFVNWIGDEKTYYSLVGVAMMAGFTTEDYYEEN